MSLAVIHKLGQFLVGIIIYEKRNQLENVQTKTNNKIKILLFRDLN